MQVPIDVAIDYPVESGVTVRVPALQTRQLWEGTVTEVRGDAFVATLTDKTNPANPDELVELRCEEVSDDDREFIFPGAGFYWIIGSERTPAGQLKNVSLVQFRRVASWTRSALQRASEQGHKFKEIFRSEL